jgi:sodium/potassium/calcium exchanger 6
MALSEPLGGGMFASNVVFGLVVLIASKQDAVIQRLSFLKDVYFYLVSLLVITLMLADGKVRQQPTADCRNVFACM